MVQLDLTDSKEGIFKRPKTVRDLIGSKREIRVNNLSETLDAVQERDENQGIIYQGPLIVPDDFYSAQNFSKRGPFVELNTFARKPENRANPRLLIENQQSELKARIAAIKGADTIGPWLGWMWRDPEAILHMVRPTAVVEGRKLEHFCRVSKNVNDKIHIKERYSVNGGQGYTIIAQVPSRSDDPYDDMTLQHVPCATGDHRYVEWTRLSSDHRCKFKTKDFTFRAKRVERYCPHDVAAFVTYSRIEAAEQRNIPPQVFPLFTEPILRAFTGLTRHAIVIEEFKEDGKTRHRSRPFTFPEIDAVLMAAWVRYGNQQTFFVRSQNKHYRTGPPIGQRKTMPNYDWSNNAPGLPFGKD